MKKNACKFDLIIFLIHIGSFVAFAQESEDSTFTGDILYIKEINVKETLSTAINSPEIGSISVGINSIQELPRFAGAVDPIRTLRLMPGIQTTVETSAGLYVRGSQSAHNLVQLNGAPVYNAMHMLGFFSILNNDILDSFVLDKSFISSKYGGRIGSILTINTLNEVPVKFGVKGNVGILSSNAAVDIPVTKNSGLYLAGRVSYVNPLLKAITFKQHDTKLRYNLDDMNAVYVWDATPDDKITASFYKGRDKLSLSGLYASKGNVDWGNTVFSTIWDRRLNPDWQLSQTLFSTYFHNSIDLLQSYFTINMPSSLTDIGYKAVLTNRRDRVTWEYGMDYTYHHMKLQYPDIDNYFSFDANASHVNTHESALFAESSFGLGRHTDVKAGLRVSTLTDVEHGSALKTYLGWEPRLGITFRTGKQSKVSASATRQEQYINQVTVSTSEFPTDFWLPTSSAVPPQKSWSFSLGYARHTKDRQYEFSAEIYYKRLSNQMETRKGMVSIFNSKYDIYEGVMYGKGRCYGGEVMVNKRFGKFTGWLSYTLGWAERSIPGIENGRWFPMSYERRHDASLVAVYEPNERWTFSAAFVYSTGHAYTPSTGIYVIGETIVNEYGDYNSFRMPPYHRLDVSASYEFKSKKLASSSLNLSIYNAYARRNPFGYYTYGRYRPETNVLELKKRTSTLYSILPSISYSFRF